jgi:hypothetical protein
MFINIMQWVLIATSTAGVISFLLAITQWQRGGILSPTHCNGSVVICGKREDISDSGPTQTAHLPSTGAMFNHEEILMAHDDNATHKLASYALELRCWGT